MNRRQFLLGTAATLVSLGRGAQAQDGAREWHSLSSHLKGPLVLPSSAGYDQARKLWNPRLDLHPRAIAMCADAADVQTCVQWATQQKLGLTARAGGHSYEGFCLGADLIVDVSSIQQLALAGSTARVGAGCRLGQMYRTLSEHELAFPGGSCPTVGVAGYTLGGGYGLLSRRLGLACDNLLAAEIVTPDGRKIRANAHSHPDLLWGLRGAGGGNFGVVTELELGLHPLEQVTGFRLEWPWDEFQEVAEAWMSWALHADERFSSALSLVGGRQVRVTGLFAGSKAELGDALPKWGHPKITHDETASLATTMAWIGGVGGKGGSGSPAFKVFSDMLERPIPSDGLKALKELLARPTQGYTVKIQLDSFGGRINKVSPDATSFCHRGALACFQALVFWSADLPSTQPLAALGQLREAYRPFASGRCYQNYVDKDLANPLEAYYGSNLPRLRKLKVTYDPTDLLRAPQTLGRVDN